MTTGASLGLFRDEDVPAPGGSGKRFGARWRLVGAGLSNVWRFGDLRLPAPSGRLLLRGPNGTGKTTALEALWPYLLDLNAQRLAAGKARPTTLASLMRDGASGRRRYGYAWLSVAGPGEEGCWSFGVRLQYSEGASPAVTVLPFVVPGEPLTDVPLYGAGRSALTGDEFVAAVTGRGGQVFDDEDAYLAYLAARLWSTNPIDIRLLATRLRAVRNPTNLGDVSAKQAAEALRESLPTVPDDVITATAEALAESDATREAFHRDRDAAAALSEFAAVWSGHVIDVVRDALQQAATAADGVRQARAVVRARTAAAGRAERAAAEAQTRAQATADAVRDATATTTALERSEAYQTAGRLADLAAALDAQTQQAASGLEQLAAAGQRAAERGQVIRRGLQDLADDVAEQTTAAAAAGGERAAGGPLVRWADSRRQPLRVGDRIVDPGPGLRVDADPQRLLAAAEEWTALAEECATRSADAALALVDLRPVTAAETAASVAAAAARHAAERADSDAQHAARREAAAAAAAQALLTAVHRWAGDCPTQPTDATAGRLHAELVEELGGLRGAEPGHVLAAVDDWQTALAADAARAVARLRELAQQTTSRASEFRAQAAEFRRQADELRAGRLLPLPRPAWAGVGDDRTAFGAVLEWQPTVDDPSVRARLEAALAASGALGAALTDGGPSTQAWVVHPAGPPVTPNLGEVLRVDPDHPGAAVAEQVLQRITLAASASSSDELARGLSIGWDGTFRAGVLTGRPAAADPPGVPNAQHVGAHQRRAAALRQAAAHDQRADQLSQDAAATAAAAATLLDQAEQIAEHTNRFPSRTGLRAAEANREAAAHAAQTAADAATAAAERAAAAREQADRVRSEWALRTAARGLPTDPAALSELRDDGQRIAGGLRAAAAPLAGKLWLRLERLLADVRADDELVTELNALRSQAQQAHDVAAGTDQTVRTLRDHLGRAAEEAVTQHRAAQQQAARLTQQLDVDREQQMDAVRAQTAAQEQLNAAQDQLAAAEPAAHRSRATLRGLLDVPGVAHVVLGDAPITTDDTLLDQVDAALHGRRSAARRTVRERYDDTRGRLAGSWLLDVGDTHGPLDIYVLTHTDVTYTPLQAAAHAQTLHEKAYAALAAAEETALRDFVIGRLPGAIGLAWTRLHDWVVEVNRKMRAAAASSGVGVQVQVSLRDDLASAARGVYELSCRVADADRTPEQRTQVGAALQQLLAAADGDTMTERLADAVDVRHWIDVHYQVTRPGATPQRWGPKTGLSGGERRLVVLAPMLAAVAAAYDRHASTGLRLAALDEVPAEVDERGRQGLARYLAELDLDLLCTSYLWDGAPGAWDGIDAHDLEAAPDGTVVAFPMLIRGLHPLPDDPQLAGGR